MILEDSLRRVLPQNSEISLCALIILTIALAPMIPRAHADIANVRWVNTAFSGTDPYYAATVSDYQTGSTATLYIQVTSNPPGGPYINVTGASVLAGFWAALPFSSTRLGVQRNSERSQPVQPTSTVHGTVGPLLFFSDR